MALTLNPNGTATVTYRDVTFTLYEPTLDQMAELTDLLDEVRPDVLAAKDEIDQIRAEIPDNGELTDADAERLTRQIKAINERQAKDSARLMVRAVELLASDPDAAARFAQSPPVWAAKLDQFQRLILHFHNVPFDGPAETSD